jgi:hypothetical protein
MKTSKEDHQNERPLRQAARQSRWERRSSTPL